MKSSEQVWGSDFLPGPTSDWLCWCSNSKLGHFHAQEFLPKRWKVQCIPRGCGPLNTQAQGTSCKLKILAPVSAWVTMQGLATSAMTHKRRVFNWSEFCTWTSCCLTPPHAWGGGKGVEQKTIGLPGIAWPLRVEGAGSPEWKSATEPNKPTTAACHQSNF